MFFNFPVGGIGMGSEESREIFILSFIAENIAATPSAQPKPAVLSSIINTSFVLFATFSKCANGTCAAAVGSQFKDAIRRPEDF